MRKIIFALGVIFALIAIAQGKKIAERISPPAPSVKQAIAFAEQQIGAAYCYGAPTGNNCPPGTFDCSGLVYAAYKLPFSQRTPRSSGRLRDTYATRREVTWCSSQVPPLTPLQGT